MTLMEGQRGVELQGRHEPERVHGRFETAVFYADEVLKLSQVRGNRNGELEAMKSSIEKRAKRGQSGLINPYDLALIDEAMLAEYLAFTNHTWGSHTDLAQLARYRQPDGRYPLVIAGNTRHEAIYTLEAEGRIDKWPVESKLHPVESVDDILDIQLDENLHTQPPKERRAIAVVESYLWGQARGHWSTQKEFLEQRGSIGRSTLSEAIAFVNLPESIRKFVFHGHMGYDSGLQLGRIAPTLQQYYQMHAGLTPETTGEEQQKELNKSFLEQLTIMANKIADGRLNSSAAAKYIVATMQPFEAEIAKRGDSEAQAEAIIDEAAALFDLDLKTPDEIIAEDRKELRAQLTQIVRHYGRTPASWALDMIDLQRDVLDPAIIELALADFERSKAQMAQLMGQPAVGTTTQLDV